MIKQRNILFKSCKLRKTIFVKNHAVYILCLFIFWYPAVSLTTSLFYVIQNAILFYSATYRHDRYILYLHVWNIHRQPGCWIIIFRIVNSIPAIWIPIKCMTSVKWPVEKVFPRIALTTIILVLVHVISVFNLHAKKLCKRIHSTKMWPKIWQTFIVFILEAL